MFIILMGKSGRLVLSLVIKINKIKIKTNNNNSNRFNYFKILFKIWI